MIEAQIRQAIKGSTQAFTALRDTIDGKPAQATEAKGEMTIQVINRIPGPKRKEVRERQKQAVADSHPDAGANTEQITEKHDPDLAS